MPGLFHILSVGSEALHASRQGVDTTGHNIANAQVEGFSRQRVNVKPRDPLQYAHYQIGNGAYVGDITRSHDKFIEAQLNKAKQDAGHAESLHDGWQSIELIFSPELNSTIPDQMSRFFSTLSDLSGSPEDPVLRTALIETGKDLALSFRKVDDDLKTQTEGLNEKIRMATVEISDRLQGIANLNLKIQESEAGQPGAACDLRDQRDKLLRELSSQVDIQYYEDRHGMLFIRGPGQATLVDGVHAAKVGVVSDSERDGSYEVVITDWNNHRPVPVTEKVSSGSLRGLIDLRDEQIPSLSAANNLMAYEFASNFNRIHESGFGLGDYAERTGRKFFSVEGDPKNAASTIDLDQGILVSPDAISVASSPLAPGDNVIANQLLRLKDQKFLKEGSMNLNEFYSDYAGSLGFNVTRAGHFEEVTSLIAQDLVKRREAVAGVSLDEEATNMLKWQATFTASSKLITTCDEMIETVLGLKR